MDLLCFCSVLCLLCLCARLFICALWSPAGKGLTSWLSFVVSTVSLSLSHWYPGSGVVLDFIDFLIFAPLLTLLSASRNIIDKTGTCDAVGNVSDSKYVSKGAQWFSGRVLGSRPRGRGFEPHRRHCVVSLSKTN